MTKRKVNVGGRPRLEKTEKKSVITQFRLTPAERKKVENAAKTEGKKLSDWLRGRALSAI
jgi:uncharacterized protein (DUF1778 family)